jgi:signal transduction histidine kinase
VQEATDGQIARRVLITPELENLKVPSDIAEQIHHIVKEAVTNACRHADAGRLQVRLEPADRQAVITVEDDGRGFEPGRPSADGRPHFGLSTMQARATRIGGRLTVESVPGHGTRVTLWWPLDNGDTGGTIRETHSSVGG